MSVDESNKAHVRRIYLELFNQGKLEVADQCLAPDAVDHEPTPGFEGLPVPEALKALTQALRAAFPDLRFEINDLIAEGDKVAAYVTMRGTHLGEFMGVPATGKSVEYDIIDIIRLQDGMCTEHWGVDDQLGLLKQLGVIPEPEVAPAAV